jgi:hypothetical protein
VNSVSLLTARASFFDSLLSLSLRKQLGEIFIMQTSPDNDVLASRAHFRQRILRYHVSQKKSRQTNSCNRRYILLRKTYGVLPQNVTSHGTVRIFSRKRRSYLPTEAQRDHAGLDPIHSPRLLRRPIASDGWTPHPPFPAWKYPRRMRSPRPPTCRRPACR